VDRERFLRTVRDVCTDGHSRFNIGTYKEKKLHLTLKNYFEEDRACQEIPFGGFVADIMNSCGITEIQTSGFARLRDKLEAFLEHTPVTLVYPVAQTKWITWIDPESGEFSKRNKSPKKGKYADVLPEMVFIHQYLTHPGLTVRVVLLEIEEYRLLDGKRSLSRKRGSSRFERMPVDILGVYDFTGREDYLSLLSLTPGDTVTSKSLMETLRFRGRKVSAAMRVLESAGVTERIGKQGNTVLYRVRECDPSV